MAYVPVLPIIFSPVYGKQAANHYTAAQDQRDKPTPRAISERLVKMRHMVKATGGGFTIQRSPSTPNKQRGKAETASTPGSKSTVTPSSKRKHGKSTTGGLEDDSDEGGGVSVDSPSMPPKVKNEPLPTPDMKAIKLELAELGDLECTPTKRARRTSSRPAGMVPFNDYDNESERESSASEFLPEEFIKSEDVGGFA